MVLRDATSVATIKYDPTHVRDLVILTNRFEVEMTGALSCNLVNFVNPKYKKLSNDQGLRSQK